MDEDKRRRSRVCAQFDAYVYIDGEKIPVSTQNISMKGALFCPEPRLAAGRECTVVFSLAKDIKVRLKGTIVRSSHDGMAIDFESMDESAFFHLRNMVRYSAEDADKIDQELQIPAFEPLREGEHD
ncbi:type IV pilus assembly PilZ [Solidesulfovibrio carbinoliphilus subsp. oakridgensis]|uniref:Type IV pilus assembly PilZ n=1 Tax=Solidesulfovibrio carbinoliphilus subsp. oakridgensis TaxID=694327 RepID=G7Q7E5_9BACT|nr:PilZ domain-containing protein [Solidesulfovibrio carbinoliphilus]EHJ47098.1 type IV pilus assembly PilZ [Solidesulfovibrio carbinoliphilus subsp. oakridgensis]